ncbi:hypothetical protein D3C81_1547810 [compost metagenome]
MAFLFQAFGVLEHRAANVVADIGELVRFAELHDVIPIEKTRRAAVERFERAGRGCQTDASHTKPTNIRATRARKKAVRGEIQPAEVPLCKRSTKPWKNGARCSTPSNTRCAA